jgi:hypothetical protein
MHKSWQYNKLSKDIRGILCALDSYLEASQIEEVEHFVNHGEYGEALRTLGWLLVEENKDVGIAILQEIERVADAMGMRGELPPNLHKQVEKSR